MKKIFTIGETVFDIIFKDSQPQAAKAGGSMLNTSVSLGRLGLPVSFISEIGEDMVGELIVGFLIENNVDLNFISRYRDGKTALALAFLNEHENADYTFYKLYPQDRLSIDFPEPDEGDILLFGSFFAITSEVRQPLLKFISAAKKNNALVIYDPNFRRPHLKDLPDVKDMILENVKLSSIVRGSDEDFALILDAGNADEAFAILKGIGCHFLVYTGSDKTAEFRSDKISFTLEVPKIKTVSTIGAGDSFNAGLIWYFFNQGISATDLKGITENQWREAVQVAISFGSHVCERMDNYISNEFAARLSEIK